MQYRLLAAAGTAALMALAAGGAGLVTPGLAQTPAGERAAPSPGAQSGAQQPPAAQQPPGAEETGEGLDPLVLFQADLALVRGQIRIADELVKAKAAEDALFHILQVLEEIYPSLVGGLIEFNIASFADPIAELAIALKEGNAGAPYEAARKKALDRLAEAARKAPPAAPALVAATLARVAKEEYEASIENGAFRDAAGYQNARGFLLEAQAVLGGAEAALAGKDRAALDAAKRELAAALKAVPSAAAPEKPTVQPEDLAAIVGRFEEQARKLAAEAG